MGRQAIIGDPSASSHRNFIHHHHNRHHNYCHNRHHRYHRYHPNHNYYNLHNNRHFLHRGYFQKILKQANQSEPQGKEKLIRILQVPSDYHFKGLLGLNTIHSALATQENFYPPQPPPQPPPQLLPQLLPLELPPPLPPPLENIENTTAITPMNTTKKITKESGNIAAIIPMNPTTKIINKTSIPSSIIPRCCRDLSQNTITKP